MRLAIADPPYPPNLLAAGRATGHGPPLRATCWYAGRKHSARGNHSADAHPDAADWNDPARHRQLAEQLIDEFDGWAIACPPDAVAAGIYAPLPYGTRVMVWHRSNALPSRTRIGTRWEAVLVCPPLDRIPLQEGERQLHDVLSCAAPGSGFAGAKPRQWTRWVLDALGYDPDVDEVVDLFPGSGAVSAEVAQGVLL